MNTFKPVDLQSKLGTVFNSVQADGSVIIDSRSRPDMVLILKDEHDCNVVKVDQFYKAIKIQELEIKALKTQLANR